jgi:flagellar basal body-associated protein FliL
MRNTAGLVIVIAIVVLLIIVEFVIPMLKGKKPQTAHSEPQKEAQP